MVFPRHDRRRRLRPMRGFTLVELITAASLMTLMMMGVVQIFAIITETASEAQGNAFAMEQGRALLDSIHRDIRGFDRGGYFRIQRWDTQENGTTLAPPTVTVPTTRPGHGLPIFNGTNAITWYSSDCLALTSVGYWEGQNDATPCRTLGAEVVYTANVKTPTTRLEITSGRRMDPRRGLLARGVWVVDPATIDPAPAANGLSSSDRSQGATLADLGSGKATGRLSLTEGTEAGAASPIVVAPLSDAMGWNTGATDVWQVRRVAASCTSEFMVDILNIPIAPTATNPPTFDRKTVTVVPGTTATTSPTLTTECPRAIRVTVAAHDPNDKKPQTGPSKRYEGYALQEVFWISDP